MQHTNQDNSNKKDKEVCLIIETPQGTWESHFSKTEKISDVISAVISHYEFAPDGNYQIRTKANPKEELRPERTLVSYGFSEACQDVVFTDLGKGA
jgi:hypothetical protein